MFYYRVSIAYKGTHYFGWQAQSSDSLHEEKATIEGTILQALKKISNYQACTLSAASRTDGGVHAQGQLAKISIATEISPEYLLMGLNSLLPADIRIVDCQLASKDYQPNRSSVSKEYHYYFDTAVVANVASADIALHLATNTLQAETLALLRSACQLFVGQHDFYNFSSRDNSSGSTRREIFECDILPANFTPLAKNIYYLKIVGGGFLKYMIRYLMGALIELSKGRITLEDISVYLQQHQQDKLSPKAPAKGLHLININER
ncbi:MAG: tRNA pseudouridine38-40 synthase [Oceanicoccus sp.]|jgi:tRNA pseudouridine38-40 synthase